MDNRVDSASRHIQASPQAVNEAFVTPGAMEQWLPPQDMIGEMLRFDWREGGGYRMRLTYRDQDRQGKSGGASDEVEVRLVEFMPGRRIVQEVDFESDDPAFAETMRMIWSFKEDGDGTVVSIRAENVPDGIRPEDHQAGLDASLANLAHFVEADPGDPK